MKIIRMAAVSEVFAAAFEHHQAGRVQLADGACRQVVALAPDHPDAWHLLGLNSRDTGNHDFAIECIQRALKLNPDNPAAHNNLGILLKNQGELHEAIACSDRALRLKPDFVHACNNLGNVWHQLGRLDEAIASCRQAIQLVNNFCKVTGPTLVAWARLLQSILRPPIVTCGDAGVRVQTQPADPIGR